jgi:hypothetical protein
VIWLIAAASTLVGTGLSGLLSLLPALHVYNVLGGIALGVFALQSYGVFLPPEVLVPLVTSLGVGGPCSTRSRPSCSWRSPGWADGCSVAGSGMRTPWIPPLNGAIPNPDERPVGGIGIGVLG